MSPEHAQVDTVYFVYFHRYEVLWGIFSILETIDTTIQDITDQHICNGRLSSTIIIAIFININNNITPRKMSYLSQL